MVRIGRDVLYGAVMLGFGAFLLWEASDPKYRSMGVGTPFDPVFYPRILLYIWMAVASAVTLRGLVRREAPPKETHDWVKLAVITGVIGAYTFSISFLGFFFSSVLLCGTVCLFLRVKQPVLLVIFSVLFPLATWFTFVHLLALPLPVSPWFSRL